MSFFPPPLRLIRCLLSLTSFSLTFPDCAHISGLSLLWPTWQPWPATWPSPWSPGSTRLTSLPSSLEALPIRPESTVRLHAWAHLSPSLTSHHSLPLQTDSTGWPGVPYTPSPACLQAPVQILLSRGTPFTCLMPSVLKRPLPQKVSPDLHRLAPPTAPVASSAIPLSRCYILFRVCFPIEARTTKAAGLRFIHL